jgi:glycosyltransferase involved in cell wall biosynthesis
MIDMTEPPLVDIVVPVYNEEIDLEPNIRRLHAYLEQEFSFSARITIVDNASRDDTPAIATRLSKELHNVRAVCLPDKGRGRAIKYAWSKSDAEILVYMDIDLSTDLKALLPLVAPLVSGHSDVSIGSRLAMGARVVRGPKRELISRCYNLVLHTALGARFRDAQCGFKAIRRDVAAELLPSVEDNGWFFDTELLILAQRRGLRIHELPVDWTDDPDSRVDIVPTAVEDLRGVWRISRTQPAAKFAAIGVLSTGFYLALLALIHLVATTELANIGALLIATAGNTLANRRFTFGIRERSGLAPHLLVGFAGLLVALALTDGGIRVLEVVDPRATLAVQASVLVPLNISATVIRYFLLHLAFRGVQATHRGRTPDRGGLAIAASQPDR